MNCLDVCYSNAHSMAVVPDTISSSTSSEYRLRGLLYLGVFTLGFGQSSESDFSTNILPSTCRLWWRMEPVTWSPAPASWPPRSKPSDPPLPSKHHNLTTDRAINIKSVQNVSNKRPKMGSHLKSRLRNQPIPPLSGLSPDFCRGEYNEPFPYNGFLYFCFIYNW